MIFSLLFYVFVREIIGARTRISYQREGSHRVT